jgi:hypothetical protein
VAWWQVVQAHRDRDSHFLSQSILTIRDRMRFGIKSERSERPKLPQRVRLRQSTSTYRVPSESEDSSDDEFEEGVVDGGQSDSEMGSEDSFCYASESEVPALTK